MGAMGKKTMHRGLAHGWLVRFARCKSRSDGLNVGWSNGATLSSHAWVNSAPCRWPRVELDEHAGVPSAGFARVKQIGSCAVGPHTELDLFRVF